MRTSFPIVTLLVVVAACSRATSAPSDVSPGQSIQLAEGDYARVSSSTILLQFVRANDSRCPSDVVCVSAGEALIAITFNGAGAERTDTLRLMKPNTATYGGYVFEATDLQPYPKSQGQIPGRTLTLRVSKVQ
jgi:hypothetical protein